MAGVAFTRRGVGGLGGKTELCFGLAVSGMPSGQANGAANQVIHLGSLERS